MYRCTEVQMIPAVRQDLTSAVFWANELSSQVGQHSYMLPRGSNLQHPYQMKETVFRSFVKSSQAPAAELHNTRIDCLTLYIV